MILAHLKVISF